MAEHKNHNHPISVALREWATSAATPNESAQTAKNRLLPAGGSWDRAAASPVVPVEIKQLMISHTGQKGTLYNILSDQRMPWADLEAIYEKVGKTPEAKFRLLKNRVTPLPFLLQFTEDYHKNLTPLLFSKPGVPVSAFKNLMAEYGRQMDAWLEENPGSVPVVSGGRTLFRSHDLQWFITAANNWVAKQPDPYVVGKAILALGECHGKLMEIIGSYFHRQDVTWERVKAISGEGKYDNAIANGFLSVKANKVPVAELRAIASGSHEARVEARVSSLLEGYKDSVPKLTEALGSLLDVCPHDELAEQIDRVGTQRLYGRNPRQSNRVGRFTDGDSPAEKFLLGRTGKDVPALLGLFSFHYTFEAIKEAKAELAELLADDTTIPYAQLLTRGRERVIGDTMHRLKSVIESPEGAEAFSEWLEANYPELTEVPFDWVLEVLT